jgi:hypothetical protein
VAVAEDIRETDEVQSERPLHSRTAIIAQRSPSSKMRMESHSFLPATSSANPEHIDYFFER